MADNVLTLDLHNRQQAWAIITTQLYPFLKGQLQAEKRLVLTCGPRKRTPAQNRRYWSGGVLAQIAAQAVVNGRLYSAETWHESFKRQFLGVVELPNGEVIGKSSKGLTTTEFSEFCTQVEAFACTQLGVVFSDLEPM